MSSPISSPIIISVRSAFGSSGPPVSSRLRKRTQAVTTTNPPTTSYTSPSRRRSSSKAGNSRSKKRSKAAASTPPSSIVHSAAHSMAQKRERDARAYRRTNGRTASVSFSVHIIDLCNDDDSDDGGGKPAATTTTMPRAPPPSDSNDEDRKMLTAAVSSRDAKGRPASRTKGDEAFAQMLARKFQEEDEQIEKRTKNEARQMGSTIEGKATVFVQNMLSFLNHFLRHKNVKSEVFKEVAIDLMVPMVEGLLRLRGDFEQDGKDISLDLGVHYTKKSSLDSIGKTGLLTRKDQKSTKTKGGIYAGEAYGAGIYTADDPVSSRAYGEVGLIVARLKGKVGDRSMTSDQYDTLVAHKGAITVLQKSEQCIALVQFNRDDFDPEGAKGSSQLFNGGSTPTKTPSYSITLVIDLMVALQEYLDVTYNNGKSTKMQSYVPKDFKYTPSKSPWDLPHVPTSPTTVRAAAAALPLPKNTSYPFAPMLGGAITGISASAATSSTSAALPAANVASISLSWPASRGSKSYASSSKPAVTSVRGLKSSSTISNSPLSSSAKPASGPHKLSLKPSGSPTHTFALGTMPLPPTSTFAPLSSKSSKPKAAFSHAAATISRKENTENAEPETINYLAPKELSIDVECEKKRAPTSSSCSICLVGIDSGEVVASLLCGHLFHEDCIKHSLKHSQKCPDCRQFAAHPTGKMPSGTMSVSLDQSLQCKGFPSGTGTFVIQYIIPSAQQKCYHDNPGENHGAANRTAYLPNTAEGQNVLKRLKYAFRHGLTFTVGTSMTSGATNQVIWSSIHHKTKVSGGQTSHGFPDDNYLGNVNGELSGAGVPPADLL